MNKLLAFVVAFGFFACVPASAQNDDHHGDRNDRAGPAAAHAPASDSRRAQQRKGEEHSRTLDTHRTMSGGPAHGATPLANTRRSGPASTTVENQYLPASGDTHRQQQWRSNGNKKQNNSGWSGNSAGRAAAANSRQSGSNWSANGHRPDINAMRRNMRASRQFHGGSYSAPQGYQYRHWSYGERLPRGYYVRNYWIANFTLYDLFAPPSEFVWVRVGSDALLIDRESGEIVQVRYGVFY